MAQKNWRYRKKVATDFCVHPAILAKRLNVHLRTVFRLCERGQLTLGNGVVMITKRRIAEIEEDLERSMPAKEAAKELGVTMNTLASWRDKGLLEYVYVFGAQRYLKSSVRELKARMKTERPRKRFSFLDSEYAYRYRLLLQLNLSSVKLNYLIRKGEIPTEIVRKKRVIRKDVIEAIVSRWQATCWQKAAGRILGIDPRTMPKVAESGRVQMETVLGRKRVVLDSIARTPEEKKRLRAYLKKEKTRFKRRMEAAARRYSEQKKRQKKKYQSRKMRRRKSPALKRAA